MTDWHPVMLRGHVSSITSESVSRTLCKACSAKYQCLQVAMAPRQVCQLRLLDSGLSATVKGKRPEPSRGEGNRQLPQVTSSLPGALGKGCSKPVLSAMTATTTHGSTFKLRTQSLRHVQELRSHRKLVVTVLDVAQNIRSRQKSPFGQHGPKATGSGFHAVSQ